MTDSIGKYGLSDSGSNPYFFARSFSEIYEVRHGAISSVPRSPSEWAKPRSSFHSASNAPANFERKSSTNARAFLPFRAILRSRIKSAKSFLPRIFAFSARNFRISGISSAFEYFPSEAIRAEALHNFSLKASLSAYDINGT